MAGWERFEKSLIGGRETEPTVKIGRSGNILVNGLAMKLIKDAEWVQLLYDRANKRIGIKPVEEGALDAYRLLPSGKGKQVNAKTYIKYFGLEDLKGTKHRPKYDSKGVLVVELAGSLDEMRRRRILDKAEP